MVFSARFVEAEEALEASMVRSLAGELAEGRLSRRRSFRDPHHSATLQAFARQTIDGLWLTGLVLDRQDMALRGRAMNPELIPAYVGRLNQEPALQGRSFRALDIARPMDDTPAVASVASAASASAKVSSPAGPHLASFVEFSLSGAGGAVVGKESR